MSLRIGLIVAVLIWAAAGSARADGPAMPAAPSTEVPCKPSKTTICGPSASPSLSAALAGVQKAGASTRARRGLGLPSPAQLFGRAGARAQALADARLLGSSKAAKSAHASAAARLQTVGSVGAVKVQATPAPGLGAGVDEITYSDRIYGPKGSQTRSIRFTATAAACPIAAEGTNNAGHSVGMLLAAEHIVTTQRSGRLELTTDFTVDTIGNREYWGTVNGNADLRAIIPKTDSWARIRRVRRARDLRTGRIYREKPLELRYEIMSLVGLAMQSDNSGFDQFISRYAGANGDDPADAVVSDRLLNGDAFEVAAQTFMLAAGARAWEVYKRAEQEWRTPNRCVEAHGDVPARLIPGQGIKVHVSATSKRGDPPQNLRAYARFAPYRTDGLTVDPYAFVDADADVAATFTVTPPAQAWPDDNPHHLRVVFYSTGGIGAIDADLRPQSLPIHYQVLSASYSVQTKWSRSGGSCDAIGPVAGTITLAGNSDGVVQDITSPPIIGGNILEGASLGGPLQGGIWAKAKLTVTEGFTGCKTDYATQHLVPCSVDYPTTVLPGATTIGANVKVSNPASGEASFEWMVNAAGNADPKDTSCNATIYGHPPREKTVQTVPLARLLSAEPQTYTFAQTVHLDEDGFGTPASLDYIWNYTITVQRM